jgi:hypothetical protein
LMALDAVAAAFAWLQAGPDPIGDRRPQVRQPARRVAVAA